MFPIVGFLAYQILVIVGSQIETKMIFSLVRLLTNLKKCCLQSKKIKRLIFVNKNWPNDFKIDCKPPFNLVELIEKDFNFETIKEFEDSFEWNELLNI
jgi:hypothetical protein